MRKGTFSVQKANSNSSAHNSRKNAPKYLVGLDYGNENYYELLQSDDNFIEIAKKLYKQKIKQTMQKKQVENLVQETVLTLQKHQNENDVKNLFVKLNKKYGGHELLEVSIHRDEGHFEKNGIAYYPTKNILQVENDWYICSDPNIEKPKKNDFDKKVNINEFEKIFNYHAHAKFSMFDRAVGKSARMNRTQMSERIKFVSENLGLVFSPGANSRVKKSVNQIKDEHHVKAQIKQSELAKVKDLTAEIKAAKLEFIESEKATKRDYAALRELENNLREEIRAKSLSIEDMQEQVIALKTDLKNGNEAYQDLQMQNFGFEEENKEFENSNKSLKEQKEVLEVKVHDLEAKSISRQSMNDYVAQNKDIERIKTYLTNDFDDFKKKKESKTVLRTCFNFLYNKIKSLKDCILGLEVENTKLKTDVEHYKNLYQDYKDREEARDSNLSPMESLSTNDQEYIKECADKEAKLKRSKLDTKSPYRQDNGNQEINNNFNFRL